MNSDFSSEMQAWREVLRLRKGTVLFFSAALVILMAVFLITVWQYRVFLDQVSQLTTQVEVIAEVDEALERDQQQAIQQEIEQLPMVKTVEYWSAERSAEYIDRRILSGYVGFLKKNQLEIPVNPLFRIQLVELDQKESLVKILRDRYGNQLYLLDSTVDPESQSFARQFIARETQTLTLFQMLIILQFILLVALSGYLIAFVLSERSQGFHLNQFLHMSPPYTFWPALWVSLSLSFCLTVLGVLLASLFLGQVLWLLAFLLFCILALLDLILVWFGCFVIIRWGMR